MSRDCRVCGRPDRDRAQAFKGTDICSGLCDQVVKGQLTKEEALRRHALALRPTQSDEGGAAGAHT